MADGEPVLGSLFIYVPNQGAPVFFAVAFAVSAVGHIWQCYRYKSFKLMGLHPLCAVLFTAGFALREVAAFNYIYSPKNLIIYILSQVFIYICPPLLELANYHVLGRIFYYVPYLAPLPPGRVLAVFGALMAVVEILNALGVALASNPSSSHGQQETGSHLTIAALTIQLIVILVFVLLAVLFHSRCTKKNIRTRAVITPLATLYASMALIFVRCVYRLVEHTGNTTVRLSDLESLRSLSPILRYEWYFYVFDGTLMLINSMIWNVWNPGRFLPKDYHIYLSRDGATEVRGEEKPDGRSAVAKVLHVLTFGLLFRRKRGDAQFHELTEYPPTSSG